MDLITSSTVASAVSAESKMVVAATSAPCRLKRYLGTAVVVAAFVIAACGSDDADQSEVQPDAVDVDRDEPEPNMEWAMAVWRGLTPSEQQAACHAWRELEDQFESPHEALAEMVVEDGGFDATYDQALWYAVELNFQC